MCTLVSVRGSYLLDLLPLYSILSLSTVSWALFKALEGVVSYPLKEGYQSHRGGKKRRRGRRVKDLAPPPPSHIFLVTSLGDRYQLNAPSNGQKILLQNFARNVLIKVFKHPIPHYTSDRELGLFPTQKFSFLPPTLTHLKILCFVESPLPSSLFPLLTHLS